MFTIDNGHVDLVAIVSPPFLPAPAALTLVWPNAAVIAAGADDPTTDG